MAAKSKHRKGTDGRVHARLSASESSRWINCPGSVNAIDALPDYLKRKSSRYADEGTAAHALAELCMAKCKPARHFLGKDVNGFMVDEDMADAVQVYLDFVDSIKEEFPDADHLVEQQFHLDWLDEDCFGTNDFCSAMIFGTLVVVDYKHGAGVPVDVEGNTQLMYYALGVAKLYEFNFDDVLLVIVQPRCATGGGAVRKWSLKGYELKQWGEEVLGPAARATREPDAPRNPGSWCRWCSAASTCPALMNQAAEIAKAEFEDEPYDLPRIGHNGGPNDEIGEMFSKALKWIPSIEAWIKAVVTDAYFAAEAGVEIPGKKLVEGKEGNREWIEDQKKVVAAIKKAGASADDMYTDPKLKTPAQMEKISPEVKKAIAKLKLTQRKAGKRQLVDESDSRPAVGASLLQEFEPFDENMVD